jgi:hypothetical protein
MAMRREKRIDVIAAPNFKRSFGIAASYWNKRKKRSSIAFELKTEQGSLCILAVTAPTTRIENWSLLLQ